MGYDALDRRTSQAFEDHGYSYSYDKNSNLLSSTHQVDVSILPSATTWSTSYTYDVRDLIQTVTRSYPNAPPRTSSYTAYSATGVPTAYTNATGKAIAYTLHPKHEALVGISGAFGGSVGTVSATYSYDDAIRLNNRTLSNGASTAYAYDARNLVTRIHTTQGAATLHAHEYGYDAARRRAFEKNVGSAPTQTTLPALADIYDYDTLDRIVGTHYGVPTDLSTEIDAEPISPGSYNGSRYSNLPNRPPTTSSTTASPLA